MALTIMFAILYGLAQREKQLRSPEQIKKDTQEIYNEK